MILFFSKELQAKRERQLQKKSIEREVKVSLALHKKSLIMQEK